MLGKTASDNRVFVYEVAGVRQNTDNDKNSYPFRSSSSVFIKVPYQRMNDEMRRITRMGGTILSIKPWTSNNGSGEQSNDGD